MTKEEIRLLLEEDFKALQAMTIKEQLLFRKWQEIQNREKTKDKVQKQWEVEKSIWRPKDPYDYLNLTPVMRLVKTKNDQLTWNTLRTYLSTMPWAGNVGRLLKFLVLDKHTRTFLGIISISSDYIAIKGRDEYIGWSEKNKLDDRMLGHICVASRIVPTQPFGFSYVGGKLLSLLSCSDRVEQYWNNKYSQQLAGVTTTSLYGGYSQYNNLRYWRKCRTTQGNIFMFPSDDAYTVVKRWVKEKYPEKYQEIMEKDNEVGLTTNPKWKLLGFVYQEVQMRPPVTSAPRGVYFCKLYNNTNEFLRKEQNDLQCRRFDNNINVLVDLWKEKYAKKRVESLLLQDRYSTDILWYYELHKLTWEEAKEKFLKEI